MDNSNKIIPPHLNAQVYRTDTSTNTISHLDYLHIHPDDGVLIGCSELTGRYWNGGATICKSIEEAYKQCNAEKKSISLTTGTADGCFLGNSTKVLLCEDNGTVSIWSFSNGDVWQQWEREAFASEHDNAVLAVDCLESRKEYVTSGADGNVKVWDVNEMLCIQNYIMAHSLAIYSVSVKPKSDKLFATGSQDQYVTLWDKNTDKSVSDLAKNNSNVRCLQWLDENNVIFADEGGVLSLIDIRKTNDIVKLSEFPAAVHRILIHPESRKVAVCCDNKIVSVCDITTDLKANVIYHERHMHNNFVRGLAWDLNNNKTLHSLGWDGEIKTHKIVWN
ncbi:hypothetical protein ACJJTC_001398 [Scirpophaga incertulas]